MAKEWIQLEELILRSTELWIQLANALTGLEIEELTKSLTAFSCSRRAFALAGTFDELEIATALLGAAVAAQGSR